MLKKPLVLILSLVGLVVAMLVIYTWFTLSWSYSEGERAGYLEKISKKGWLCKTWEGEIRLVGAPGAMTEKFAFSVRDDKIAKQLSDAAGKRVVITYEQHKGIPTDCFGESEHFVEKVLVQ